MMTTTTGTPRIQLLSLKGKFCEQEGLHHLTSWLFAQKQGNLN
jgi:hypothetical protein